MRGKVMREIERRGAEGQRRRGMLMRKEGNLTQRGRVRAGRRRGDPWVVRGEEE
jgi:hypothetical protein